MKKVSSDYHVGLMDESNQFLDGAVMHISPKFFRHATSVRNSSYPFVSGDTFRGLADFVFDETTNTSEWADVIGQIKFGDIVFVQSETQTLKTFFAKDMFSRILHPFVLITHNSDASVPTPSYQRFLDHEKILAWFTQNPDSIHDKLYPIPIGMANIRWPHGNVSMLRKAYCLYRKAFEKRSKTLYVNFDVETNRDARSEALRWAKRIVNVSRRRVLSFENYLREIGDAKFVLSPAGNGLDCHRTWEALLMGAVPIVLRSSLDSLFINESVLVVDKWDQLNLEYLEKAIYHPILSEKLLAEYWHERLLHAAGRN